MFKHLLVPLDGSHLAEAALPAAAYLAQKLQVPITLAHVIERDAPSKIHGEPHLANEAEACAYLDRVAARAFSAEVRVKCHVHPSAVSDVARSLVEHVGEFGADLIVMCTHGRGGLRDWLTGTLAQQVISLGTTPVLLIHPTETGAAPAFACRRLLVPLDGDPDHEQGLAVAVSLAQSCAATLQLIMVVHTVGTLSGQRAATARLLPGTTLALLELKEQQAVAYLQPHLARLQAAGLTAAALVSRGEPAKVIVQTGREAQADLIVLGTHGKTNLDAFWSGSITPKVANQPHMPLLLVPVGEAEAGL
jgi:nucleotide-binding universal stress UspA family protein